MSRKHEAFPPDDRMAAAFTDGATEDTVAALIEETESAARAAGEGQQAAVSRLRDRLAELRTAEEDNRRRAAYEEARAERDELAAEFARVYPPLAAQLADLLGRLRASDDRIEYINAHALPRGCRPLLVAELVARGLDGFVQNSVNRASSVGFSCRRSSMTPITPISGRGRRASMREASCFKPFADWVRALPEWRCA